MNLMKSGVAINERPETSIYIYFCLEDITKDEVVDLAGEYDWDYEEEAPYFVDVAEEVVEKALKESLARLQPIIEHYPVDKIVAGIDVLGMIGNALATCSASVNCKGQVVANLLIGADLLNDLLKSYWYKNHQANPRYALALDHELLHAMDQIVINENHKHPHSINPFSHFMNWFTSFRVEGLAELVTYLRGIGGERSLQKTTEKLDGYIEHLLKYNLDEADSLEAIKDYLKSHGYARYEYGPLMMLHAIFVQAEKHQNKDAITLAAKGLESEIMSDEEIGQLIHLGLQVSHGTFLLSLKKPGYKGFSFFSSDKFDQLIIKLYVHHRNNDKRYSDHIFDIANKDKESLIESFHDLNESAPEEFKSDHSVLERSLVEVLDNEDSLLKIGSEMVVGMRLFPIA